MGDNFMYVDADTGKPINMPQGTVPQNQSYIPTGQMNKSDKADLLEKIRPDFIVEVIKNHFMGNRYDEKTKSWIPNNAIPEDMKLTEAGATYIATQMLSVSSQNVSISNLKDREINLMIMDNVRTLVYDLIANWKKFGIKSESQITHIATIVKNNTRVVLRQPEGEGIRRLLAGIIQESRVYNTHSDEKKGGLLSWMRRR